MPLSTYENFQFLGLRMIAQMFVFMRSPVSPMSHKFVTNIKFSFYHGSGFLLHIQPLLLQARNTQLQLGLIWKAKEDDF